jgi:hypothetical protein
MNRIQSTIDTYLYVKTTFVVKPDGKDPDDDGAA